MHHTLREYARAKLPHIAPHLPHTLSSRCVCECVLQISSSDMCFSTASDPRARKWADACRSMTDAHGQLPHVQAALSQVLVDGDPPCRRRRNAFWHSPSSLLGSLGPSYRRGVNMSKSKKSQKAGRGATGGYFLSHKRPSDHPNPRKSSSARRKSIVLSPFKAT